MISVQVSDVDRIRAFLKASTPKKNRRVPEKKQYSVFGRPLQHIPRQFQKGVLDFTGYLADTSRKHFKITSRIGCDVKEKTIDYVHRWTPLYRKSILAKLYQLEAALTPDQKKDVTMITLTTSQRGEDQEECLFKLLDSYNKLFKMLRKHIGTIDYFYILEPHQTGYAHMHIMYMKRLTDDEKGMIINLWENKYGAGTYQGIDFAEPKESKDGKCKSGSITYLRSYLMKYLAKSLYSESMTKGELLFNSLLKKHNKRLWNCSRHFSEIMKKPEKPQTEEWECLKVELYQDNEFISQVYPLPQITTYPFSPSLSPLRMYPFHGERAFHVFCEAENSKCLRSYRG